MSYKIYNGYKFKKNYDLKTVQKLCLKIRQIIEPLAYKLYLKRYYKTCFEVIDKNEFGIYDGAMYFLGKKNYNFKDAIEIYFKKRMQNIIINNQIDSDYDFNFSFSILPTKGKLLILLYAENSEIIKAFESFPFIESYYYQDSSDKPDDIPTRKWRQRRKDWDYALGGNGFASANTVGFLYRPYETRYFTTLYENNLFNDDEIKTQLYPSLNERVNLVSSVLHLDQYNKQNPIDPSISSDKIFSSYNKIYWAYLDHLKTTEGKKERNDIKKEVRKRINKLKISNSIELHENNLKMISDSEWKGKPTWMVLSEANE